MVQKNSLKQVIAIVGATATGKTTTAINLAKKLNTSIISCDSMQVYKYMDIGTAKPTADEQAQVAHYMIDVVNPNEDFNVSIYSDMASSVIDKLCEQGKTPIIVGGTGMYLSGLLFEKNLGCAQENKQLRDELTQQAKQFGNTFVHDILKGVDPESANEIHENNLQRVIRAIEIYKTTGKTKSQLKQQPIPKYNYKIFGLDCDRQLLYDRIDTRVDIMVESGLIEEVQSLLKCGYGLENKSMQAIGYKEIIQALNGEYSMKHAIELIKQYSRNYAKRQLTWFRAISDINWLNVGDSKNIQTIMEAKF